MTSPKAESTSWRSRRRQETVRLAGWTGAWLATMAIAAFGPTLIWSGSKLATGVAAAVNLLVGVGMIVANRNHLRSLDELQQRIHFEAMAVTLGLGLVVGLAYSNLDVGNVIPFDAEISHLVIVMGLTYIVTLVGLNRRYR